MAPTGFADFGVGLPDLGAGAQRDSSAILVSNGPPLDVSADRAIYLLNSGTPLSVPARRGF